MNYPKYYLRYGTTLLYKITRPGGGLYFCDYTSSVNPKKWQGSVVEPNEEGLNNSHDFREVSEAELALLL